MKKQLLLLIVATVFISLNVCSQKLSPNQVAKLQSIEEVFNTDDIALQTRWYEKFMDQLNLDDETKDNYRKMVVYHSMKMNSYDRADSQLSINETRAALEKQLALLNEDVTPILNDEQLKMHRETWGEILKITMGRIEP
ncbi:hypothetical protein FGM00_11045 [Aggregatimonas sangjinii]|uniref:Uncharacterized protein n=1 Tax=Aggregatimonas sangjinii TaxID=2583587 RepID=A0A5B7SQV9_9FLAO|nr:hypothetical protein [Aggregatimonas sangjinii]QCX00612.1 hypothetical protein FGM00_11045 [Aggregatimonas sangjinii]